MRRAAPLLLVAGLAACTGPAPLPGPTAEPSPGLPAPPAQCRVGPDGGMPVADRGIGGTGARVADRGIGGTGAPTTGIVGVITGFASVCLAGQEVPFAPDLPVLVDGRPAGLADLRVGQVAAVGATGAQPVAQSLAVRHEVSGRVDRVDADGTLHVAGQRIVPPPGPDPGAAPGQWLLVSGVRRADGTILATRLDGRGPGPTLIRGVLRAEAGRRWIGEAELRSGPAQSVPPGTPVVAIGWWHDGMLDADTVEPDGLLLDPSAYFGGAGVLVIEGYAEGGSFGFGGRRFGAPVRPGFAVLRLERGAGGAFNPVSSRPSSAPAFTGAPRAAFEPAPVPNRGIGGGGQARGERGSGLSRGAGQRGEPERQPEDGGGNRGGGFGPGSGFGSGGFGNTGGGRGGPGR